VEELLYLEEGKQIGSGVKTKKYRRRFDEMRR
jgi:hypothetical protein